ncbi:MAG: hypothetical protein ABWY57_07250, partial [Mycetocola sp.]
RMHPFEVKPGDTYFITFLEGAPSAASKKALVAASNDFDTLVVHGRDVHRRMRGKSTDTTVSRTVWSGLGEHGSTSRNVNLLEKLVAKLEARVGTQR